MRRRWRYLPTELRQQIIRLGATGATVDEIGAEVGVWGSTVGSVLRPLGGVIRPGLWESPSGFRLSLDDRVEIRIKLEADWSFRRIGELLARSASTVSREVNANGGRVRYAPMAAHRRAHGQARRPKPTKLASNQALRDQVVADLERLWSPEQIAERLRCGFPDHPEMWVSHETIYKSLYVQGRGELRRELAACLRTGRAARKPRGRLERRGRIPDMVMISDRPAEIEDRSVPGHWEGDLIIGKNGKSAVGTLVERSTRFVMLLHLGEDRTASTVRQALASTIQTLPAALRRSITWDQGREMSEHAQFTIDTDIDIYFCDPHSPWQRGSNENTNGLLRQYLPKGTDLALHDRAALDAIADSLNGRPRKTLGWMTPSEQLNEVLLR